MPYCMYIGNITHYIPATIIDDDDDASTEIPNRTVICPSVALCPVKLVPGLSVDHADQQHHCHADYQPACNTAIGLL